MIAIIDYDAGNLKSVEKALVSLGQECVITRKRKEIMKADRLILPGVGAFGDAMGKLEQYDLVEPIQSFVKTGKPFLGICLGLQLMFESSEETPGVDGLNLLPGRILRIPDAPGLKIPHIGWNSLTKTNTDSRLLKDIKEGAYVYFVHSYYLKAQNEADVCASTFYSTTIHVAVEHENVFACQFHPEKSGTVGLQILTNFTQLD